MLKRFYSKKSGFTLVEIVVAFAIFSIMASMVVQILDLALSARDSNNLYASELARQQQMLSVIQKDNKYYDASGASGMYNITLDGETYSLAYQTKAADPEATNQAEGINYFLTSIDYEFATSGEEGGDPTTPDPTDPTDPSEGGMSQSSRMDTRLTGTQGLGYITVWNVQKDTYDYSSCADCQAELAGTGSCPHIYLPAGHTRYYIMVSASGKDLTTGDTTLTDENAPYAQYRMFFYHTDEYAQKIEDGFSKDVFKKATITDAGHVNGQFTTAQSNGLTTSLASDGSASTSIYNKFYVEQMTTNCVRVGAPVNDADGDGKPSVRFTASNMTRMYVDFEGDPKLTTASFGHNGVADTVADAVYYGPCPVYNDDYNSDGTPTYDEKVGEFHPCLYGGYMYKKAPDAE